MKSLWIQIIFVPAIFLSCKPKEAVSESPTDDAQEMSKSATKDYAKPQKAGAETNARKNASDPLVGEYSIKEIYANLKIEETTSGKFNVFIKKSEYEDWIELPQPRQATNEELEQALGDRWEQVESSLVAQKVGHPQFGLCYINPGQFGSDLHKEPIYMLFSGHESVEINKFNPGKAATLRQAKENEAKDLLQKIEALKTADIYPMPPYGELFNVYGPGSPDSNNDRIQLREKIENKIFEWSVFVNDVVPDGKGYRIKTSTVEEDFYSEVGFYLKPTVCIIAPNAEEKAAIEALESGEKIKVRGSILIPEDPEGYNMLYDTLIISPAIIISETGISKSEVMYINKILNATSSEILPLENVQREVTNEGLTSLQKNNIIKKYEGKIVEGSIYGPQNSSYDKFKSLMPGTFYWCHEDIRIREHFLRRRELNINSEILQRATQSPISTPEQQLLENALSTTFQELRALGEQYDSETSKSRLNTALSVIITPQTNEESNWLKNLRPPERNDGQSMAIVNQIRFRGVINRIEFANKNTPVIHIIPAILKPDANPLANPDRPGLGITAVESMRPGPNGALIVSVIEGSPAAVAGLKVGDIIFAIDDMKVHTSFELLELLARRKAGEDVKLEFSRNDISLSAIVTLVPLDKLLQGNSAKLVHEF